MNIYKRLLGYVVWVLVLALFFAQVEIQIEGAHGWASQLPTWRIEKHWLLDIFWGGRPLTGYHAWVFSFMALVFFMPLAFNGRWTWRDAGQALGGLMLFWVVEDFGWFVMNPAYGFERFHEGGVAWHHRWFLGAPPDYWFGVLGSFALFAWVVRHDRIKANERLTSISLSSRSL